MSDLTVAELGTLLPKPTDQYVETVLGDVSVSGSGAHIELSATGEEYQLDEVAERSLCRFLGVPFTYLEKCSGGLKAANLNHWLSKKYESDVVVRISAEDEIEEFYAPDRIVLPPHGIAEVVAHLFRPSDRIAHVHNDGASLFLDVTDETLACTVEPNGILDRVLEDLPEIGDLTNAGLRFGIPADLKKNPPTVEAYFHRVVTGGGLTVPQSVRKIRVKGQTVDDVLEGMENAAKDLLSELPEQLRAYRASAVVEVPGNHLALIRQIAHEEKLPKPVMNKAVDYASGYADKKWSAYDVVSLLSRMANTVRWSTARKLQALAGDIATDAEGWMQRCTTCEQPLAAYQKHHDHNSH